MNAHTAIERPVEKLRLPFPDNQVSKLPKETRAQIDARKTDKSVMVWKCEVCGGAHHKNAVHLDYVGHAALTDRLLDTDLEWNWEPMAFGPDGLPALDRNGGLWIKLTVCGVTRPGYGSADGKSGGDAIKEIIGDALRNAAMRFGAALDLWHKGDLHAEDGGEPNGGSGEEHNGGRAASPTGAATQSQGKPAPWREPESMYSTPSKLHAALARLERELHGCGDTETLDCLTLTDEWKEFVRVADLHSPHYLYGGEPAPEEFLGLLTKAQRMRDEFQLAVANNAVDMLGAG